MTTEMTHGVDKRYVSESKYSHYNYTKIGDIKMYVALSTKKKNVCGPSIYFLSSNIFSKVCTPVIIKTRKI